MSFGYSVGDVITGANLTYRLIRIMADTKGASFEYLEAMNELSEMQQAFLQVSHIRSHKMLPAATVNAASHIVLSSMETIAKFLERSKHYQKILENPRASTFQSSWYKVGWTLYKSHELRALRDALHSKLTSVHVLLSAASYCTPLPATLAQYQGGDPVSSSPTPEQNDPIRFRDAVGRKFTLPWHICNTWQSMEELIKQAFDQVDVLRQHVRDGHYDLIGGDGAIILPSLWDKVVSPGMLITMTMRPMENLPPDHGPTNIPERSPPLPAGWEVKTDALGRPYLVDHNTGTTHGNQPNDSSHQSSKTMAAPSSPSTPQSTTLDQVPTTRRGVGTGDSGISVEGQDHEFDAPTSDSEDWEDYTDDEETMAQDDNGSC